MRSSITVALVLAAAPSWAAARPARKVILTVDPAVGLVDVPVAIRVEGLAPREEVTLRASTDDGEGHPWRSEAVFRASAKGVVDPSVDGPLRGAWTGADAMAPFWSMQPVVASGERPSLPAQAPIHDLLIPPSGRPFPRPIGGALEVRLEVHAGGTVLASAVAVRELTGRRVKVTEVREQGLVGRMYEPEGPRRPAVLVLGGSQGGIPAAFAPVLAGHGYVAFALAYFRADGLPVDLVDVPRERLERGLEWLRARLSVDPGRVAVLGHSRGAEAALLLASMNAHVKAVVALAPSHVVWEGAVRDPAKKGLAALKSNRSAWTRAGQALPFVPKVVSPDLAARVAAGERFHSVEMMRLSSVDLMAVERARIPVEKIRGPVLLVSSLSDRMWPAADMADRVTEALRAARFPHRVEHRQYDGLAHVMPDAWLPAMHGGTLGGTAEGTMSAFGRYWPAVLSFLDVSLGGP